MGEEGRADSNIRHFTSGSLDDLNSKILSTATGPVCVIFTSSWCAPSRKLLGALPALAQEEQFAKVVFVKVDVEDCPELAEAQEVTGLPYIKVFVRGQLKEDILGFDVQALRSGLASALEAV